VYTLNKNSSSISNKFSRITSTNQSTNKNVVRFKLSNTPHTLNSTPHTQFTTPQPHITTPQPHLTTPQSHFTTAQ
jgi:hypothetical protein